MLPFCLASYPSPTSQTFTLLVQAICDLAPGFQRRYRLYEGSGQSLNCRCPDASHRFRQILQRQSTHSGSIDSHIHSRPLLFILNLAAMTQILANESLHAFLASPYRCVSVVALSLLVYTIYGAIYRLYLSSIAHIPGPLFARLTFWNKFYYDVVLGGKYTFVIKKYHGRYGKMHESIPSPDLLGSQSCQVRSYVSILMKFIYLIQTSTNNYTLGGSKGKVDKWHWSVSLSSLFHSEILELQDMADLGATE